MFEGGYALRSAGDVRDVIDVVCNRLHICLSLVCDKLGGEVHLQPNQ